MTRHAAALASLEQAPTVTRIPYWLATPERTSLAETLIEVLDTTSVFPAVRTVLEGVLTELGVAEARDRVWPDRTARVRATAGLPEDVLPIRMSRDELDAVFALPTLPSTVRAALHHPAGKS